MKKILEQLHCVPLFRGIMESELVELLYCLQAQRKEYQRDEIILSAGQKVDRVGIVLEGWVQIIREDLSGNRTIIAELGSGELFAETFAFATGEAKRLPVMVLSVSSSTVLWIQYRRMVTACASACHYHVRLIENMRGILADKNLLLNRRLGHLSKRSTREKLMSYFEEQALRQGSCDFYIPFDRQELADYLCVERSAMSATLSKMQKDGLITVNKNHFILHVSENDV